MKRTVTILCLSALLSIPAIAGNTGRQSFSTSAAAPLTANTSATPSSQPADPARESVDSVAAREVADLRNEAYTPMYSPGLFRMGFFAGVGGLFRTGEIANGFSNSWTFNFGLQVGYGRFNLEGLLLYGTPSIDKTNRNITALAPVNGNPFRANVEYANLIGAGFGAGFSVLDTRAFGITPWVGGLWTTYRWTARPMEQQPEGTWIQKGTQTNVSIDDFNVAFGINLEWHFDRRDTDIPLLDSDGQEYVSSLRLMPYAARAVYPGTTPALNGWQIGFTVAYSGIARALNLE